MAYRRALAKHFSTRDSATWTRAACAVARIIKLHSQSQLSLDSKGRARFNLKQVSRDATLAAGLQDLFDIRDVPLERLQYLGETVHRLTVGKKKIDTNTAPPDLKAEDLERAAEPLIDNLQDLFRDATQSSFLAKYILCEVSGSPQEYNPLNLIIPIFEAPWRVTYYTLLSILQPGPSNPKYVKALRDCRPEKLPPPGTLAIIYESLRLYPPIRRVRRDERVDIETVMRDPQYWGPTATKFDPARFLDKNGNVDRSLITPGSAWMPFAVGSMRCPTMTGYSARMMTVIVGEVLRRIFSSDEKLWWDFEGDEWDHPAQIGEPLRAGREQYGRVNLVVG